MYSFYHDNCLSENVCSHKYTKTQMVCLQYCSRLLLLWVWFYLCLVSQWRVKFKGARIPILLEILKMMICFTSLPQALFWKCIKNGQDHCYCCFVRKVYNGIWHYFLFITLSRPVDSSLRNRGSFRLHDYIPKIFFTYFIIYFLALGQFNR